MDSFFLTALFLKNNYLTVPHNWVRPNPTTRSMQTRSFWQIPARQKKIKNEEENSTVNINITPKSPAIDPRFQEDWQSKNSVVKEIETAHTKSQKTPSEPIARPDQGPLILIVAPHPDDEILCCSDTIAKKIEQGYRIKIVIVTDGDANSTVNVWDSREYSQKRRTESVMAAQTLGLPESDVIFLGFPDGGLSFLGENIPFHSAYTGRNKAPLGTYAPHTVYSRAALKSLLQKIITQYQPQEVYAPSLKDMHPDHKVTGRLIKSILSETHSISPLYQYTVHANSLSHETSESQNTQKLSLIRIFQSQYHTPEHQKFMEMFARMPEYFELSP